MTDNDNKKPIKTEIVTNELMYFRRNDDNVIFSDDQKMIDVIDANHAQGDMSLSYTIEETVLSMTDDSITYNGRVEIPRVTREIKRVFRVFEEEKGNDDG